MSIFDVTIPTLIKGGLAVDDRGQLSFCNDLSLAGLCRHYMIKNHTVRFKRRWHGHMEEIKVMIPIVGTWVAAVFPFEQVLGFPLGQYGVEGQGIPIEGSYRCVGEPKRFTLSADQPAALIIPAGYMNGTCNLTEDASLLVLSNKTLAESGQDDFRMSKDESLEKLFEVEER